ncbi:PREDICTED: rust resistance kinase Lr10-like isoform X2 [Ipomoea nil]|uniref:rust resistance kinase Lr10-like isoform X2 n=1 Tax=Ipomoea nil TaxID=35883 RepID=UPI000900C5CB|nr:PREDICTED: rust resistance kinase Lr10-like isoform X2 [Ipomoea nil]
MLSPKLFFAAIFLLALFCPKTASRTLSNPPCAPSSCGDLRNISFPFRLNTDPQNCGDSRFVLECRNNQATLTLTQKKYNVLAIDYSDYTIRVVDPGLQDQVNHHNCTSFPKYVDTSSYIDDTRTFSTTGATIPIIYVTCSSSLSSLDKYVPTTFCAKPRNNSYVAIGDSMSIQDVAEGCSVEMVGWGSVHGLSPAGNASLSSIHAAMSYGVEVSWMRPYLCRDCEQSGGHCFFDDPLDPYAVTCSHRCYDDTGFDLPLPCSIHYYGVLVVMYGVMAIVAISGIRLLFGIIFLISLVTYKWRRRHLSADDTIEDFLNSQNKLLPINYSYGEIKKMANDFKEKLGEGANGTVYKGKLRSGPFVAVKMMEKSLATGKEFISEVATIGRIHHVNVVHLIGFCVEGSNRALVYEFMPNGSLDKYVFSEDGILPLSYKQMFEISLGVARGIDYLHRGCDKQILHFDIKPHNILLDEHFTPKISDFGLAKLYPTDNSIVTLTAARGTVGYMAPELFYKNIGGVSYKADVYSFGMLLMEMASKRRNMNPFTNDNNQIYFPTWIYDQIIEGNDVIMSGNGSEEERKVVKKMIVVALWCIQMKPADRPAMNRIVEMLEGDGDELVQMPPRPFVAPREMNGGSIELSILPDGSSLR